MNWGASHRTLAGVQRARESGGAESGSNRPHRADSLMAVLKIRATSLTGDDPVVGFGFYHVNGRAPLRCTRGTTKQGKVLEGLHLAG